MVSWVTGSQDDVRVARFDPSLNANGDVTALLASGVPMTIGTARDTTFDLPFYPGNPNLTVEEPQAGVLEAGDFRGLGRDEVAVAFARRRALRGRGAGRRQAARIEHWSPGSR